jgi:hypothetical protein
MTVRAQRLTLYGDHDIHHLARLWHRLKKIPPGTVYGKGGSMMRRAPIPSLVVVVAICTIAATGRAEGLGPLGTAAETMANVAIRAVEADDQGIAFVHVNVVPMTAERVDYHQTVLVTGGEITAVGPSHEVEVPENTTVIDGDGAYLMPGLADMHVHTREDWMGSRWPARPLEWCQVQGY